MTVQDFMKRICPLDELDKYTVQEIVTFAERKIEEAEKIKGQIARQLSHFGEHAYCDPKAYDKIKARYKAQGKFGGNYKQLAILEQMKNAWCKE